MPKKITRRQFITSMAGGFGLITLTCAGFGVIATRRPVDTQFRKLATDLNTMKPVALVTYASRAGSTMEIARMIALQLENRNFIVDISPIEQVTSLKEYSHVVIGSAIRMGTPLPEVTQFIEENSYEFNSIPLAFFAVHLQNSGEDEASRKARAFYLDPIHKLIHLQDEAFFTGVYDPDKVSLFDRLIGKMVNTPIGDFRDWEAIKDWGLSIFSILPAIEDKSEAAI